MSAVKKPPSEFLVGDIIILDESNIAMTVILGLEQAAGPWLLFETIMLRNGRAWAPCSLCR